MKKLYVNSRSKMIRLLISACLIILGATVSLFNEHLSVFIFLSAYFLNGYDVIGCAASSLFKKKEVGEKMLMTIASLGAVVVGAYFEAAFIMALYLIGELIEGFSSELTKKSVNTLAALIPNMVRIKGKEDLVRASEVGEGEIIEVLAGERIPLDGKVIGGAADLDTSAVTGESLPVHAHVGTDVYASHLNLNGVLTIKVTKRASDSMAQRIVDISLKAKSRKTKSEAFLKRFSRIYTPSVIVGVLLTFLVPVLFGASFADMAYKAFSILAISCPCAIVISVPVAYASSIGYASRNGILIKGSRIVDALASLNTMAFDKTGTLTQTELRVTKLESYGDYTKMDLLAFAAIAEKKSKHPIARAILKEAKRFKIDIPSGKAYHEEVGYGIECDSPHGKIKTGSYRYAAEGTPRQSKATVYVSLNGKCIGYIGVGDNIKANGKITFEKLRANGIKKIYILSGDKKEKVDIVASTLYADGAYSQLLPNQKIDALVDIIEGSNGVKIGYCGDGINDLPAIIRADVGFSINGVSTDAAIEHSDVIIADDDLEKIPKAVKIAKNTKAAVVANVIFAIAAKLTIGLVSLLVPSFPMVVAVIADVGIMLITLINALNAGKIRKQNMLTF